MSCRDLLRAILRGDDRGRAPAPSGRARRLAAGEDGMISLVAMVTVVFLLAMAVFVANVVTVVNQKIEVQNAADSITISAGTQLARGMNAVTAMNHLIGELLAIVVLHDAIAGDRPNEVRGPLDPEEVAIGLDVSAEIAKGLGANLIAWEKDGKAGKRVKVEAAVLDAKVSLKKALTILYIARAICNALKNVPYIGPVFKALDVVLMAIEAFMFAEWMVLEAFEQVAKATEYVIRPMFNVAMPGAALLARMVGYESGLLAYDTAQAMGKLNNAKAALYPERPYLPLVTDPLSSAKSQEEIDRSQLTRASWPLVVFHRQPILDFTVWMVFSQFRKHYIHHTEGYMRKKSFEAYKDRHATLQVLALMDPEKKGEELWTSIPPVADRYFAIMGFAHRKAPRPEGSAAFAQSNPDGLVAFAQAILYNANGRDPNAGPRSLQRAVGWDTLNWKPAREEPLAPNQEAFEYPHWPGRTGMKCPLPLLNWQVKLTPATRIGQAKDSVPSEFRNALRIVSPSSALARTH